jgi:prevent-host-death family protein
MTIYVNMHEVKSRLSELVAAALQGEEVILQKAGVPQARIVPTNPVALNQEARIAKRKALFGRYQHEFPAAAADLALAPQMSDSDIADWEAQIAEPNSR